MTTTTLKSLATIRTLIEQGWTQGSFRGEDNPEKPPCYCLMGAVYHEAGADVLDTVACSKISRGAVTFALAAAVRAVAPLQDGPVRSPRASVIHFNDEIALERGHVLDVIDAAIAPIADAIAAYQAIAAARLARDVARDANLFWPTPEHATAMCSAEKALADLEA